MASVLQDSWNTAEAGRAPRCSTADEETPAEEALRLVLGGRVLTTIPLLNDVGVTGWLFVSFDDVTTKLSARKLAHLGTFAQFCLLMQERLHVMTVLEDRERLLRQTERLAKIGSGTTMSKTIRLRLRPRQRLFLSRTKTSRSSVFRNILSTFTPRTWNASHALWRKA